jgi:hypothetical protein
MHERTPSEATPKQQLIELLTSDFTPAESVALTKEAQEEGDALGSLLATSRSTEEIDARMASEENILLGERVAELVAPASITEAFKGFIVSEVRRAHAWQDGVDDAIAPDRLGLTSGDGIFDPKRAEELEGQAVRRRLTDIVRNYTFRFASGTDVPLALRPDRRPQDYVAVVSQLSAWEADYEETYSEHPFEDIEADALLAALPGDVERSFGQMLQDLRELREREEEQ